MAGFRTANLFNKELEILELRLKKKRSIFSLIYLFTYFSVLISFYFYLFIYFTESSALENYKNPLSLEVTELQLADVNIVKDGCMKFLNMIQVSLPNIPD